MAIDDPDLLDDKNLGEIWEFHGGQTGVVRFSRGSLGGSTIKAGDKFLSCGNTSHPANTEVTVYKFFDLRAGTISLWNTQYIMYFTKVC